MTMNRGRSGGTLTLATRSSPLTGSPTLNNRLRERLEIYGKGCPGSTASGVSTGKIWRRNTSTRYSRSSSSRDAQSESLTPASASAGTTWSKKIVLTFDELVHSFLDGRKRLCGPEPVRG